MRTLLSLVFEPANTFINSTAFHLFHPQSEVSNVADKKLTSKPKSKAKSTSKGKATPKPSSKSIKSAKPKATKETKTKPKTKSKATDKSKKPTTKPKAKPKAKPKVKPKKKKAKVKVEVKPKRARPRRLPLEKPVSGVLMNFQRGPVNQRSNFGLIQLEGITSVAQAAPFVGRTVILHYNEQTTITGRIVSLHGRNGVLRVRFRRGLASEALAKEVMVF
jgi:ribosomal protein L35AE/L33A